MSDLISRADAIEAICNASCELDVPHYPQCDQIKYCDEVKALLALPSADAVQWWRTGKPTENGEYMVTLDAWGYRYINIMHYAEPQMPNRKVRGKCWYRSDDEWGDVVYDDADILAWMPLPTPYKGGDDE